MGEFRSRRTVCYMAVALRMVATQEIDRRAARAAGGSALHSGSHDLFDAGNSRRQVESGDLATSLIRCMSLVEARP